MKDIDMSQYQPYREMGHSCELREIVDKKIVWPMIDNRDLNNSHFKTRIVTRNDVEEVAELWRTSYPEVYGSVHEWILFPEEYLARCAMPDNWEKDRTEKDNLMIVGEELTSNRIIFATIMTKWDKNLHVEMSFVAVHPDFRKSEISTKIFSQMARVHDWLADSGAEYATVFCETWHSITQYLWFKRMGWKVAGIFPGNYTRWTVDQKEYRACTVHLYNFINNGEQYATLPEEWGLIPEAKELWDCMERINSKSAEEGL